MMSRRGFHSRAIRWGETPVYKRLQIIVYVCH